MPNSPARRIAQPVVTSRASNASSSQAVWRIGPCAALLPYDVRLTAAEQPLPGPSHLRDALHVVESIESLR